MMTDVSASPSSADRRPGRPRSVEADEAIIQATIRMLAAHGFDGVTMEGVASEAGVGKATVYRRWSSKTQLVLDAIRTLKPQPVQPDTGDTRTDLVELVAGAVSWGDDGQYTKVVVSLMTELQGNADLAELYRAQFLAPRRAESLRIFQRGIERGDLRPDIDTDLVLDLLIGAVVYRSLISGGRLDRSVAEQMVDHVLAGITAR
jgi:AcrR family transcriptional regulator